MSTREAVLAALSKVMGPDGKPLSQSPALSAIAVAAGKAYFSIAIEPGRAEAMEPIRKAAELAAAAVPGIQGAMVTLTAEKPTGSAPPQQQQRGHGHGHGAGAKLEVPGVRHIIAVASGKGGVGKSTTSVNLALALKRLGLKVGILDADVYGPSLPKLFGLNDKPRMAAGNLLEPLEGYGIRLMSIGFLVEEDSAMIWRGPMVMSAIQQMLREVAWGDLDVLVVDMPPGTGDAQLTMAQNVPLAGAVIVSTPQDLALIDARRGISMFRKVDVPIIGVVENMSTFICPNCGTRHDIFGHGGARDEAAKIGAPFLGEIPLAMTIREKSDAGRPVVVTEPDGPHAKAYLEIAAKVWDTLKGGTLDRVAPKIFFDQ